jgi:hypothetical protein
MGNVVDAGAFNQIKGSLQNMKTLKIVIFQIVIKNHYAVAVFDDPAFARKMVKQENKHGNNNIKFDDKINGVIEFFPMNNKEEITKLMIKKLNNAGAKLQR